MPGWIRCRVDLMPGGFDAGWIRCLGGFNAGWLRCLGGLDAWVDSMLGGFDARLIGRGWIQSGWIRNPSQISFHIRSHHL